VRYELPKTLDSDAISKIIKEGTGKDEDAYQDAWLRVVEGNVSDPLQILQIAKDCRRHNSSAALQESFRLTSLESPAHDDTKDGASRELQELIPWPEVSAVDTMAPYVNYGKVGAKTHVSLDTETAAILRARYPGQTMWKIIRGLAGLPEVTTRERFQPWEDDIIRRVYPTLGSRGVKAEGVHHSLASIGGRAEGLKVKWIGEYKPLPTWRSLNRLAADFGVSRLTAQAWVDKGFLKTRQVQTDGLGPAIKRILYVDEQDVVTFMRDHSLEYNWDTVAAHWSPHLPHQKLRTLKQAGALLGVHCSTINTWINEGRILAVKGYHGRSYVDPQEVQFCIDHPEGSRRHPYRVILIGEELHYITRATKVGPDWEVDVACKKPHSLHWKGKIGRLSFVSRIPTCEVCRSVMRQWQRRLLQGETLVPQLVKGEKIGAHRPQKREAAPEKVVCKYCHSSQAVVKFGTQNGTQCWWCKVCRRRFTGNGSLPGMRMPKQVVEAVLALHARGFSYSGMRTEIQAQFGVRVPDSTICHWVNHRAKALRST
jgi:ribosomal protein L37AE/L43A